AWPARPWYRDQRPWLRGQNLSRLLPRPGKAPLKKIHHRVTENPEENNHENPSQESLPRGQPCFLFVLSVFSVSLWFHSSGRQCRGEEALSAAGHFARRRPSLAHARFSRPGCPRAGGEPARVAGRVGPRSGCQ